MAIPLLEHPLSTQIPVTDLAEIEAIQTQNVGSIAAGDDGIRTTIDETDRHIGRFIFTR